MGFRLGVSRGARRCCGLLIGLLAMACVAPVEDLETYSDEIVGGSVTDAPELRAVVRVGGCTGTFIHPNYILAAAHCANLCTAATPTGCAAAPTLDAIGRGDTWTGVDGPTSRVAFDGVDGVSGTRYPVDRVLFPRSRDFDAALAPVDVALFHTTVAFTGQLIRVMPAGALVTRENLEDYEDDLALIVGFSDNPTTPTSAGTTTTRRRVGFATVEDDLSNDDRAYDVDGDSADGTARGCPGDSGGPVLFRAADGRLEVGGVMSTGPVTCPDPDAETRIAFLPRPFLDAVAMGDPFCRTSWDSCVLATGGNFSQRSADFSNVDSWHTNAAYWETIRFPDVSGDGRADVCGRGIGGILCAVSDGIAFGPLRTWNASFSDGNGWTDARYYETISYGRLDNDARMDVCGRGRDGFWCALSTGSGFGAATLWGPGFSDAAGWGSATWRRTLRLVDVSGDGLDDVCGRESRGIVCAVNSGAGFGTPTVWAGAYSDANGWSAPWHASTIQFARIDGGTRVDVCGRGTAGLWCALSTGTSFGAPTLWTTQFSDGAGWSGVLAHQYWSTIRLADMNGDSRADVCGRGAGGLHCYRSTGSAFADETIIADFSDAARWNESRYYATITLADWDGDGSADACGRGASGWFCARSTGTASTRLSFAPTDLRVPAVSDAAQWDTQPYYYRTLQMADVGPRPGLELCGRSASGISCSVTR